jgi:Holliday junction resolvase RusA-like endonuclease
MAEFTFTVIGKPQPAGSKKGFVNPKSGRVIITDDAKKSRPWKQQVAGEARARMGGVPFAGPVDLTVTFFVRRPKGHYGTGRNANVLKPSAPAFPTTRPDTTKLVRAVEDAMSDAAVWGDDAQVVDQHAFKRYCEAGEPERCEVTVRSMSGTLAVVFDRGAAAA